VSTRWRVASAAARPRITRRSAPGSSTAQASSWAPAVQLRLTKHLTPVFGQRRLMSMTTVDVRAFTAWRQAAGASNAEIYRELIGSAGGRPFAMWRRW
jgi:hypothetical protein